MQWIKSGKSSRQFRHGTQEKVKSKKEVILEAQRDKKKVHFATLMDMSFQNAELEPKGRVVLLEDMVKDDSGAKAVFTEQGSSASQMTAAKIMDVIARLQGCDGQAADAVPAYTHVILEDVPRLLKIPKSECPDVWIRLPRHKWPKSWANIEDPLARLLWVLLELGLKNTKLGMSVSSKTRSILIGKRGRHENGWKEAEYDTHVEEIDEKRGC